MAWHPLVSIYSAMDQILQEIANLVIHHQTSLAMA